METKPSRTRLERGDLTTLSLPSALKERLDEVKDEDQTYAEFLADLLREDVVEGLEAFRGEGDSYGDTIERITKPAGRSPAELEYFLKRAREDDSVTEGKITVEFEE